MRKRVVKYYNDRLQGKTPESDCDVLEYIIQLKEENGAIEELRNTIYDLSKEEVQEIRSTGTVGKHITKKKGTLTDAQTLGVGFMLYAKDCILGDSVGLGKTVQIASLMNIQRKINKDKGFSFRYLYLTEKTIVDQAVSKLIQFTRQNVYELTGEKKENTKWREEMWMGHEGGIVAPHSLVSNQIFHSWLADMHDTEEDADFYYFDYLIIDEGSILGNKNTQTYKYAEKLKEYCNRVIILNATPFEKNLEVFISQLNFVDETMLPTLTNLKKLYYKYTYDGRNKWGRHTGYKNADVFREQVKYHYFYHTRKGLGAKMTNTHYELREAPMSREQNELMKTTNMYGYVFDCPPLLDTTLPFDGTVLPKLDMLDDVLDEYVNSGDQVLIFCLYKKAQAYLSDWLVQRGFSTEILNGGITNRRVRNEIVEGFVNKEYDVLITSVQKGLDFGDVKHLIFYSFLSNPNKMIQMEGRITRSFDIEDKNVFILAHEGREVNKLKTDVKKTLQSSQEFTSQDLSAVVELLLNVLD